MFVPPGCKYKKSAQLLDTHCYISFIGRGGRVMAWYDRFWHGVGTNQRLHLDNKWGLSFWLWRLSDITTRRHLYTHILKIGTEDETWRSRAGWLWEKRQWSRGWASKPQRTWWALLGESTRTHWPLQSRETHSLREVQSSRPCQIHHITEPVGCPPG